MPDRNISKVIDDYNNQDLEDSVLVMDEAGVGESCKLTFVCVLFVLFSY